MDCVIYNLDDLNVVIDIPYQSYFPPFSKILSLPLGWFCERSWWAWILSWPLPRLSRWIRVWGSLSNPHFPETVSQTAQLMPRYLQDNVILVHRRHYCHADNGTGRWGRFQNCHVGCQSCPPLVSNICQIQIESAVLCSRGGSAFESRGSQPASPILLISLKSYVTLWINGKCVSK